ncbi:winged helix DNA-binding domain-containing protein [Bacteroides sp. OttesenSCG-928-D19]|nr:winged helix DNA-binding domain-containing protein [Bacteroides sp. OttesenSCG-928-D19]
MDVTELLQIRLNNQLLAGHQLKEPDEVVSWMGAMQAQTLDMAKWGIGVRLDGHTVRDVESALNTGRIIRTHILRPTWHFVSADDFHWMRDLSYPQLKPIYFSYYKTYGVDKEQIYGVIPLLEKSLSGGVHLTKQEIANILQTEKIATDNHLLNFAIQLAEIEGILCNGQLRGNTNNTQTFTLLSEWVPRKETISREEALERLARRYFTSHGPATLRDFAWWSGLKITECRQALEMIKPDFVCEKLNDREFWLCNDNRMLSGSEKSVLPANNGIALQTNSRSECPANDQSASFTNSRSALLLPPFDEFVVSYTDRSEIIEDAHYGKVMTKNGLFSPTVMLNGEIVGSWKKIMKKGIPQIELSFFQKTPAKVQALFKPEIKRLEQFYSA